MRNLQKLQSSFKDEVISGKAGSIAEHICDNDKISKDGMFGIYVNNYYSGLKKVLEMTFPAVKSLVGDDFFKGTSAGFVKIHPPQSGNLDDYGEDFPVFLKNFAPAQQLPYLPDIAMFEWQYHCCQLSETRPVLDKKKLAGVAPEKYEMLLLKVNPSLQFFFSHFPVLKIWQMTKDDNAPQIDIDKEKADRLIMLKIKGDVSFIILEKNEAKFLELIAEGNLLGEAYEYVCETDEGFDLAYYLNRHIVAGTFCGFELQEGR